MNLNTVHTTQQIFIGGLTEQGHEYRKEWDTKIGKVWVCIYVEISFLCLMSDIAKKSDLECGIMFVLDNTYVRKFLVCCVRNHRYVYKLILCKVLLATSIEQCSGGCPQRGREQVLTAMVCYLKKNEMSLHIFFYTRMCLYGSEECHFQVAVCRSHFASNGGDTTIYKFKCKSYIYYCIFHVMILFHF